MQISWPLNTVEELKKLSDEEIVQKINALVAPPVTGGLNIPITDVVGAQFYIDELDRRENRRAEAERDKRETRRWRTDFLLEGLVVVLILFEIVFAWREGNKQNGILQNLQDSTASSVSALKTMNEKLQLELDLYYEPSLLVTYRTQNEFPILEVRNYARTSITVFGVKAKDLSGTKDMVCTLETPVTVPSGLSKDLESQFIIKRVVQNVVTGGGLRPFTLYFRAENGKEFQHRMLVVRGPIAKGNEVTVETQKTEPIVSSRELAQAANGRKCPEGIIR